MRINRPISGFLDIMYSYGMFPLITKPSRVTKDTATLIDHIFTNNFETDSISDHFAVFHITGNGGKNSLCDSESTFGRNMCHANIVRGRNVNYWLAEILSMSDAQVAYSSFHKVISQKYNKCFPIRKINKRCFNNKRRLTPTWKESIKTRNKLYINRCKGIDDNKK